MEALNAFHNERVIIRRAFISAHDKTGLAEFVSFLSGRGIELFATDGTARFLLEKSVAVRPANELTGFSELLSGKVKSLSPRLHAGILFSRENEEEKGEIEGERVLPVDMVVVNFYPFQRVAGTASLAEAMNMIDIGGPAALRAAAKNFRWVIAVPEPSAYQLVMKDMSQAGDTGYGKGETVSLQLSLELAARTFEITCSYERAIADYLRGLVERSADRESDRSGSEKSSATRFPEVLCMNLRKVLALRYGENPHQRAGLYAGSQGASQGESQGENGCYGRKLHGKELSFNNLVDLDAAVCACRDLRGPGCVIVKHRSPCGASMHGDLLEAYRLARDCDPLSAFGGVIAVNRPLTQPGANEMSKLFLEVVAAPSFTQDAVDALSKKKNLRIVELWPGALEERKVPRVLLRSGPGGILLQEEDSLAESPSDWKLVSKKSVTPDELSELFFLWRVARHVVSNAIVIGRGDRTLGIGSGQTSRVDAVEVALLKARRSGHDTRGAWLASDGFFPFRDSIDLAARAGIRGIVQPGGSMRDEESIRAADEHGMSMFFTGRRCFKH